MDTVFFQLLQNVQIGPKWRKKIMLALKEIVNFYFSDCMVWIYEVDNNLLCLISWQLFIFHILGKKILSKSVTLNPEVWFWIFTVFLMIIIISLLSSVQMGDGSSSCSTGAQLGRDTSPSTFTSLVKPAKLTLHTQVLAGGRSLTTRGLLVALISGALCAQVELQCSGSDPQEGR